MPNPLIVDLRFQINFGAPVALTEFSTRLPHLRVPGVYFLRDGECSADDFDPLDACVHYIGKAIGETIYSRCRKHLWTITDARDSKGNPKTCPGNRFKAYRTARANNPVGLFVVPGFMNHAEPHLISCAEEYLQQAYFQRHGDLPPANTQSTVGWDDNRNPNITQPTVFLTASRKSRGLAPELDSLQWR